MKRIFKLLCYATLMGALVMGACTESSADEDQTEQGGSGEKPDPDPDPDPEPGPPDPLEDGKLCILAIGNSFSQDAVEQYLYELFEAAGIKAVIGNMYIGGCSLETHWSHAQSGKGAYAYRKVADGVKRERSDVALTTALADEKWDFVTLQQASGKSGVYSSYNPYLPNLIAYLKGKVDVPVWFHQTWAYMQGSNHAEFPTYGSDQTTMYNAIMSAVQQAMSDNKELAGVIPSGRPSRTPVPRFSATRSTATATTSKPLTAAIRPPAHGSRLSRANRSWATPMLRRRSTRQLRRSPSMPPMRRLRSLMPLPCSRITRSLP